MKKLLLTLLASTCLFASGMVQARSEPLVNYENVQVTSASGKSLTIDNMKAIFQRVATRSGWEIKELGNGKLAASLALGHGKHIMVIEISYTGNSYSITYRDSYNLNYSQDAGRQVIHPNYNKSLAKLIEMIRLEAQMY